MNYLFFLVAIILFNSCVTNNEDEEISREKVESVIISNKESFSTDNNEIENNSDQEGNEKITILENNGDKAVNLYDKYIYYLDAFRLAKEDAYEGIERIEQKLIEVKDGLDITIVVNSDVHTDLSAVVRKYITSKGFKISDIGYLTVLIELNTKEVELENEYYNKFWNLTVSLKDAKGNIVESKSYSGRESQITEDYLDSVMLAEVEKSIKMSLKGILP